MNELDVLLDDVSFVCRELLVRKFPLKFTVLALGRADVRKLLSELGFSRGSEELKLLRRAAWRAGYRAKRNPSPVWGWMTRLSFERR
jgi:hypothetical protein